MTTTYIHHSCFLAETTTCYYLFDYEKGNLPAMDVTKPIFVLSSHAHRDHYNAAIFTMLREQGMQRIYGILSSDIKVPADVDVTPVSPNKEYQLQFGQKLTTFHSTDVGVAFLIEDKDDIFYHAGDLNDWVWEGESDAYNEQMTKDYREQINLLAKHLNGRTLDAAFVVLDPRQERNYDRGLCYLLEHVSVAKVYPMHYWGKPEVMDAFIKAHPEYQAYIQRTE